MNGSLNHVRARIFRLDSSVKNNDGIIPTGAYPSAIGACFQLLEIIDSMGGASARKDDANLTIEPHKLNNARTLNRERLPCPFCGGKANFVNSIGKYVECKACRFERPMDKWNQRPSEISGNVSNKDDILDRWQEYVKEVSASIHYPDCWDTMAYPTLRDALKEIAGCVGCSVCKYPGVNPDAEQKPTKRESGEDVAFDTMKAFWRWWRTQQDMELRQADRAIGGYVGRFIADRKQMGVHDFNDSQLDEYFGLNQIEGGSL